MIGFFRATEKTRVFREERMAILKCKACGAPLNVEQGQTIVQCAYCDLQQTIPQMDDDFKLQMFNQANDLRMQFDFDSAKSFYQAVVSRYPQEAEAYWGICLCKYGIMYVEDQQTLAQIPTFYRMIPQSILSDEDYLRACKHAGAAAWKYEEEAQKIDKLQKKILQLNSTEEPYDVFICYKKTDIDTPALTRDSRIAGDLYTMLIENGYRVFWADRSLPGGCEYEPYIYSALSTAKIMLVLSSDTRYFEATWVKNEWIRFLDMMKHDSSKTLITCYQNMPAEAIPAQLRSLQALNMGSTLFSHDLLDHIQRKLPKKKSSEMDTEMLFNAFKSWSATQQQQQQQQQQQPYRAPAAPARGQQELALSGGVYLGDAIAGKPHGVGTYHMNNGDRYEGSWNAGRKHGQGTFYYSNGDSWSGEWIGDRPCNGSGKYHCTGSDGKTSECLEGTLKNSRLSGEGKKYVDGRVVREGSFENGVLNGQGTSYVKGFPCKGEFREGKPWNAEGTYLLQDTVYYTGTWENGQPNGKGKVWTTESKSTIEGTFRGGLNGWVTWCLDDGRRYVGGIEDGAFSGAGKMFAADGSLLYAGEYQNNTPHGQGTLYCKNGSWTGEFRNGDCWKGKGLVMEYDENGNETGGFFNGHWVNGSMAGRGIYRASDGSRFDGDFLQGEYYNGRVYSSTNVLIDVITNGKSQMQTNQSIAQGVKNVASGVLNFLSKL